MQAKTPPIKDRLFHLRSHFRPIQRTAGGLLETAPWVDVVLLVMLFVITQSATLKKPGLQVNLPTASAATGARYDAQVLTIPKEGVFFFDDERVSWAELTERLRMAAEQSPGLELIIEADESLSHKTLTGIYNIAVNAGWKQIVLATRMETSSKIMP